MAKELSINKNTKEIYEFYNSKLINTKELKNKTVLIIELGNVKYIEEVKKFAKKVCIIDCAYNCLFGDVFETINKLEIQIKYFLEENEMPKFDVAIMNPPYSGTLHLDILKIILEHSNIVVNISPSIFLKFRLKEKCWGKSSFMNGRLDKVIKLDYKLNDELFGVGNSLPEIAIYYFVENGTLNIENVMFKNKIEKSVYTKIFKKRDGVLGWENKNTKRHGEQKGHFVNLYTWHCGKNAYETCIREDGIAKRTVYFDTQSQQKNFLNSFKTTFMDFYSKNIINAGNGITDKCFMFEKELYNQPWTNKRFCEFFELTGFISDTKAEKESDWEYILNNV